MALVMKKLYYGYFWIFDDLSDPRSDNVFLAAPLSMLITAISYIYIVKNIGPKLMENRKPFEITKLIIIYNVMQIVFNIIISYKSFKSLSKSDLSCATIDYSYNPNGMEQFQIAVWYMYLKLFDFIDTIFFVLKKSYRQISFLHVYHHCGMFMGIWIGVKFYAGGEGLWISAINGVVHVFMFIYYLLTALDSSWKQSLWLKKLLTQMQLIQFTYLLFIFGRLLFKPDCQYPKLVSYLFVPQNIFMILLFGDFYLKSYVFNKKSKNS